MVQVIISVTMVRLKLKNSVLIFWKNCIIVFFKIFIFIFVLLYIAHCEYNRTSRVRYGQYGFERSMDWNVGMPFNYLLNNYQDKYNNGFFVNNYIFYGNYLYFSEVKGGVGEWFCFDENKLYLSRINLINNKIERFINEKETAEIYLIYLKINEISDRDIQWLTNDRNRCNYTENQ